MRVLPALLVLTVAAACGPREGGGRAACGIAALAGPTALLDQFSVPRQTLSVPPRRLPERIAVRYAAGPAVSAVLGRRTPPDSLLVAGVDGPVPPNIMPQFGVLVLARGEGVQGIMLFETTPVENAPVIGDVVVGGRTVPLLGIEVDLASVQDPACPLFPDSLAR